MRYAAMMIMALCLPAQAQTGERWAEASWIAPNAVSARDCRRYPEAKDAQVIAFDSSTYETKLAVILGEGQFKVVTVKLWRAAEDPRPLAPVIEAARITQGKLQFFTPNLNADPDPIHDKQFVVIATLGGAQVCWATDSALLKQGTSEGAIAPAVRDGRRRL